jgi:hypothetical protein
MNEAVLVLTGALTLLGVGYFCVDGYRNRSKRLSHFEAITDVTGLEFSDISLQKEPGIAHHAVPTVGEVSHTIENGVGHCVEAIAHTLSHH